MQKSMLDVAYELIDKESEGIAFNKLFEEGRKRVLLVTHGMLIRIFAETCLKKTIRLENGSVLRVIFDEKSKKFKSPKILF